MRIIILIFFFSIINLFGSCFSHNRLKKEVFDKVEIGMTIKEVKDILGEPDKISRTDDDSNVYYFYMTQNDLFAKRYAEIKFDKPGYVSFLYYGDSD